MQSPRLFVVGGSDPQLCPCGSLWHRHKAPHLEPGREVQPAKIGSEAAAVFTGTFCIQDVLTYMSLFANSMLVAEEHTWKAPPRAHWEEMVWMQMHISQNLQTLVSSPEEIESVSDDGLLCVSTCMGLTTVTGTLQAPFMNSLHCGWTYKREGMAVASRHACYMINPHYSNAPGWAAPEEGSTPWGAAVKCAHLCKVQSLGQTPSINLP